jgi:hypothetical protein
LLFFWLRPKKTMFFLNRRMSSAKASPFSSGFISEHEILMLLANKRSAAKKCFVCRDLTPKF